MANRISLILAAQLSVVLFKHLRTLLPRPVRSDQPRQINARNNTPACIRLSSTHLIPPFHEMGLVTAWSVSQRLCGCPMAPPPAIHLAILLPARRRLDERRCIYFILLSER